MLFNKPEKGQGGIGAKAQSMPGGNAECRWMNAEDCLVALLDSDETTYLQY